MTDAVRRRLFGVLIPVGGGLTPLVERLQDFDLIDKTGKNGPQNQTFRLVDEAWALQQVEDVELYLDNSASRKLRLYPVLKQLLIQVLTDNPTDAIIFATHDADFLTYADVKPKRTAVMLPTKDYYAPIHDKLLATYEAALPDAKTTEKKAQLRQAYLDEVNAHQQSAYGFALRYGGPAPVGSPYANLDQLEANVLAAFSLTKTAV